MSNLLTLEQRFPYIRWREPIPIVVESKPTLLGCRVCISRFGLRAGQIETYPFVFHEERDFEAHMRHHERDN